MLPAGRSIGAREEGIELRTEDCPFVIPAFPAGRFAEEAAETPAEFADRNAGPCTPLLARSCAIVCESSGRPGFFARADCRAENGTAPGAGVERVTTERLRAAGDGRSEEHTSELQSRLHLVCRLLLEKKKKRWSTRTRLRPRGRRMAA